MHKFRSLARRFPIIFSVIVISISMWLIFLPDDGSLGWGLILTNLKGRFAVSVLLVALMFLLGMGKGLFRASGIIKGFLDGWVLLLIGAVYLVVQVLSLDFPAFGEGLNALILMAFLFDMFCTGLFEEVLMRGVVFQCMVSSWRDKKNGILISAIVSSILFGLVHLLNYTDGLLIATMTQIIFSTFIGIYLCGVFLKRGNMWSVILLHSVFDFLTLFFQQEFKEPPKVVEAASTVTDLPLSMGFIMVIATLPLCILGIRAIRRYANINKPIELS